MHRKNTFGNVCENVENWQLWSCEAHTRSQSERLCGDTVGGTAPSPHPSRLPAASHRNTRCSLYWHVGGSHPISLCVPSPSVLALFRHRGVFGVCHHLKNWIWSLRSDMTDNSNALTLGFAGGIIGAYAYFNAVRLRPHILLQPTRSSPWHPSALA